MQVDLEALFRHHLREVKNIFSMSGDKGSAIEAEVGADYDLALYGKSPHHGEFLTESVLVLLYLGKRWKSW